MDMRSVLAASAAAEALLAASRIRDNAERLAGLLRDREDWWPGMQDGGLFWCFGRDGAARLVITPEPDGFLVFVLDERCWVIPRLESVKAWLDEHEHEYEGLTPLQEEFSSVAAVP